MEHSLKLFFLTAALLISNFSRAQTNANETPSPTSEKPFESVLTEDETLALERDGSETPLKPTTWTAKIRLSSEVKTLGISQLEILRYEIPIFMVFHKQKFRPLVEIPLKYNRANWNLFVKGKIPVTRTAAPGRFRIFAFLNGPFSEVTLVARGSNGASEQAQFFVIAPEAQSFEVVSPWDALKFSLGGAYVNYKQTNLSDFYAWSGQLSIQYHSPEQSETFGVAAEANLTALTLLSNKSDYGPQIAQIVIDGIYFAPWKINSAWRLQPLAGASYVTIFSNGAPFGFKNLFSLEAGIRVRKIIDKKSDWLMEARFSSLKQGFDFDQRGLYLTLAKGWILPNLHRGELGLRFLDYKYEPSPGQFVQLQTLSYTFGYSF